MTVEAPATSYVAGRSAARVLRTKRSASSVARIPIGRLMKNTQRQDSHSVSAPPITRPAAAPPAAIALQTPSAFVRSAPSSNVVVTIESAAGETSAPPKPCSARPAISTPDESATPLIADATVKTTTPAMKSRWRPRRSDARPPSSRNPPKTSV